MRARVVVFHTVAHARAACAAAAETGDRLTLRTAPGAAAYAGSQYLMAIVDRAAAEFPEVDLDAAIDCGKDAGTAQGALRIGWKTIAFSGPAPVRERLSEIAAQCGARVVTEGAGEAVLDLLDHPDPASACRCFFAGEAT